MVDSLPLFNSLYLKEYNIQLPSESNKFHHAPEFSSESAYPIESGFRTRTPDQTNKQNKHSNETPLPPIPSRVPIQNLMINDTLSPIENEPIYENQQNSDQFVPSNMDTTQEIDIDAILGYADEKAIENIEWPSQVWQYIYQVSQRPSTDSSVKLHDYKSFEIFPFISTDIVLR